MIKLFFDNFKLSAHSIDAQQYDNGTIPIVIIGSFPDEYDSWKLLMESNGNINEIPLTESSGTYTHVFTAEELAFSGKYKMQLAGVNGENIRHTNEITVNIPESISGDAEWPVLPTAFSDAIEHVESIADSMVKIDQGVENAGMILAVGEDGKIVCVSINSLIG